ncbi:hypothetical protein [Paenibacillus darwinianus]|uniref:hypothetical protein n=1 Tax=Paenibacillus darwinianus TaxID=1380763 RepID=UPI001185B951|nr:hypothetical protein [Paenibacillus darwinianus]
MKRLDGDMTIGSGANQSDVQEVSLKRGTGYLAIAKYGTSKLDFLNVNLHVAILGKLAKDG